MPEQIADYAGALLVGIYEGQNIPEDKRSVTLRVEYRSDERTLRDEEVEERHREFDRFAVENFQCSSCTKNKSRATANRVLRLQA